MQVAPIPPSGFGSTPNPGFEALDPKMPTPNTSGTGTAITTAYENNDWSRKSFLEVTGPATSGSIPHAFGNKADALAAAASLSHGNQPALAVLFDPTSGPRGSQPWVIQALQIATPQATGFIDRASKWHHTGWRVNTDFVNLETNGSKSLFPDFIANAPYSAAVHAIVDGTVLINVTEPKG